MSADTDLRRLAQEASGLLTTAVETAEAGGRLTPAWVTAAEAAADELERHYTLAACRHPAACLRIDGECGWCLEVREARRPPDIGVVGGRPPAETTPTLPCGHPVGCLRDGACGWCAAVQDARLHMEERARLARVLKGIRAGLIIAGLPPVEDDCDVTELVCAGGELEAAGVGRAALAAHIERLRGALAALSRTPYSLDIHAAAEAALASTPAASLEEHDRGIREQAVVLATGCHDYNGGHTADPEHGIYHHGIDTVIGVLERWAAGDDDYQLRVVRAIGQRARAAALEREGEP